MVDQPGDGGGVEGDPGEVYSATIVRGRPYQRKDELVQRGILLQRVYEKVKDRILAKQKRGGSVLSKLAGVGGWTG